MINTFDALRLSGNNAINLLVETGYVSSIVSFNIWVVALMFVAKLNIIGHPIKKFQGIIFINTSPTGMPYDLSISYFYPCSIHDTLWHTKCTTNYGTNGVITFRAIANFQLIILSSGSNPFKWLHNQSIGNYLVLLAVLINGI